MNDNMILKTRSVAGARRSTGPRVAWRKGLNAVMLGLCGFAVVVGIVPLLWILLYVFRQGVAALSAGFLTSMPTPVGVPGGGILNSIVGSAITVGVGILIAAPIGILAAMYAATRPNTPLGLALRFGTDVVAGVPSIIMGIFVYTLIVLPQGHFSAFSGGVALAFIMLPIIIRTTEEMLKLVPGSLREASLALGAPEWRTSLSVLLPAAISGVVTGVMLAVARAAGEAAPMLFTAFGNPFLSFKLGEPIATLPHTIFVYAISPYEDWRAKAWATALVLIVLVLGLNVLARGVTWWRVRKVGNVTR
jgi:phosphate transport system permease protein